MDKCTNVCIKGSAHTIPRHQNDDNWKETHRPQNGTKFVTKIESREEHPEYSSGG